MTDIKKTVRSFTSTEYTTIIAALATLHPFLASPEMSEKNTVLPSWEKCGVDDYQALLVRAALGLKRSVEARERETMRTAKGKIDALCHSARVARIGAFREVEALSAATRALLGDAGKAPTSAYVHVSETQDAFPGMAVSDIVTTLVKMGYKLSGTAKKETDRRIVVEINAAHLSPETAQTEEKAELVVSSDATSENVVIGDEVADPAFANLLGDETQSAEVA